ncbi:MAG TPA: RcnB family protein [Steroidobacteraceae bacterium]|nr:RcnB family protein [Steroidobacteraceae bacterium]
MQRRTWCQWSTLASLALLSASGLAQEHGHPGAGGGHPEGRPEGGHAEAPRGEPHEGPRGYQRVTEPHGWDQRPSNFDRGAYRHNYQASRAYRVGPYHRPEGWRPHRWVYGEFLPRAYWAPSYLIGDYWLFSLEVPPAGYEWVREGNDALLIDTTTGEILQVEYGVFA